VPGRIVIDPLTLAPGASVTPVLGVHHMPKRAMVSSNSLEDWPPHPGAREMSAGPAGGAMWQELMLALAPIQ
jgi:hypothetical protein